MSFKADDGGIWENGMTPTTTPQEDELAYIVKDTRREAVWFSRNKYSRTPVGHDIGMAEPVAIERLKALITKAKAEAVEEGYRQGALDAITQFKQDRIEHTLSTPAQEWERELETADRTLSRFIQSKRTPTEKEKK